MGRANFSAEFKSNAVAQITERGHPVAEVSQQLRYKQLQSLGGKLHDQTGTSFGNTKSGDL